MAYEIAQIHTSHTEIRGTQKEEFVSVFYEAFVFVTLLTENDMNTERSEKRTREGERERKRPGKTNKPSEKQFSLL